MYHLLNYSSSAPQAGAQKPVFLVRPLSPPPLQGSVGAQGGPTVRLCEGNPSQLWPIDAFVATGNSTVVPLPASVNVFGYGAVRVR